MLEQWKNLRKKLNKHTNIKDLPLYKESLKDYPYTQEEFNFFVALQIEKEEAELLSHDDRWGT